jgi:phosphate-selective porin OprO and OprP
MTTKMNRRAAGLAGATLAGLLLASTSTATLAATSPGDAKLQAMQQQLDAMRAQLEDLRGAGQAEAKLSAMQAQLESMQKQLADLQTAQQTDAANITAIQAPTGGATAASLPNGKPALATADGRFTANLRAILMMDAGKYFQDDNLPAAVVGRDLNEGTNFRRARVGFDGRVFRDFDYAIVYEFGGSGGEDPGRLYEFSLAYTALKPWRIKLGAYEPNIGLAAAVSTSQMPLMERPSPAEVARSVAAGDSRVALQVSGNGVWGAGDTGLAARWFASTALTGNTIATISSSGGATVQPFDEQQAWIGRVAIAPFVSTDWQAHVGLNAQYVFHPNDAGPTANPRYPVQLRDRPELRLDGTRLVDTGAIDARHVSVLGAEAAVLVRNFALEGEYFRYGVDRRGSALADPGFKGWYIQGSWVMTGDQRPYNAAEARIDAPKLNANFDPATGSWGALELAARYSVLDLNFREGAAGATPAGGVRGGEQRISTLGLNWYLNPALRFMLDWQHVDIDRLSAAGAQTGQEYDAVAARAQFTF